MIDIDRLVSGLQKPEAYPFAVDAIECLQTHISWVFLAGPFAYKVKKPVNFEFLDYSTLERRRFYCEEEVRLNRRLAPDVYLGVVPIALAGGQARVEGKGRAVEYAVKMMRLSAERMLDSLLRAGKAGEADVRRLAHIIADFHARAETGAAVERFGSPEAIMGNWRQNFEQMRPYLHNTISAEEMRSCEVFVADELSRRQDLFLERMRNGRIRDCHGDLRTESVWIAEDGRVEIFDCIEFNEGFRCGDVASEVAFLASDLDWRGRPDLAWAFVDEYVQASGDSKLVEVLPFHKCYRAFVRGKVGSLASSARELGARQSEAHAKSAREHFHLAELYTFHLPPMLILTCGMVGSGKSTLARGLASLLGLPVFSSDVIRKQLAGVGLRERRPAPVGGGMYSAQMTRATYDELYARAASTLSAGSAVILDATFNRRDERDRAREFATRLEVDHMVLETTLPVEATRERLARRTADGWSVSDAGLEVYEQTRSRFEATGDVCASKLVQVDMSRDVGAAVLGAVRALRDPDNFLNPPGKAFR